MNKHESLASGQFDQLTLTGILAWGAFTGKPYRMAFITYHPFPYEGAITEDIMVPAAFEVASCTTTK